VVADVTEVTFDESVLDLVVTELVQPARTSKKQMDNDRAQTLEVVERFITCIVSGGERVVMDVDGIHLTDPVITI